MSNSSKKKSEVEVFKEIKKDEPDEYLESDDGSPKVEDLKSPEFELEDADEEFADELNEEEIAYLKNTGKFFILDSLRQADTLFGDLHHAFVENHFKKEKRGSIFAKMKTTKKNDSSEESD